MIRVLLNIDIHTSSMSALVCLCIGTCHDFNAAEYLGIAKIVGTESVRIVVSAFFSKLSLLLVQASTAGR